MDANDFSISYSDQGYLRCQNARNEIIDTKWFALGVTLETGDYVKDNTKQIQKNFEKMRKNE